MLVTETSVEVALNELFNVTEDAIVLVVGVALDVLFEVTYEAT